MKSLIGSERPRKSRLVRALSAMAASLAVVSGAACAQPADLAPLDEERLPKGDSAAPAYPTQWNAFRQEMEQVHLAFEAHITGATHITIPIARKEFDWKVDWQAQQAYCKRIANAVFHKPRRFEFAWPDAAGARDGVEHVYAAIGKTFPRCKAQPPSTDDVLRMITLGLPDPRTRRSILSQQRMWEPGRWLGQTFTNTLTLAYYTGEDHLVSVAFWKPPIGGGAAISAGRPTAPFLRWDSWYGEDPATGCPREAAAAGPDWDPTNEASEPQHVPTVFLRIHGELVPVEFGSYGHEGRSGRGKSVDEYERWGSTRQRFLFVQSLTHGFWMDWARSALPPDFAIDVDPSKASGLRRACVINFD